MNGVTISVSAADTINTVLAKIAGSAAGVTATFDAASEKVTLQQQTGGSGAQIVLANDTSGFLAATKLSGAVQQPGQDPEPDRPIAQVARLSAIQTGTFAINGVTIAVDTATDTLNDVIDRINASAAGVTASLSPDANTVSVGSKASGEDLVLDDGTSNFFSAVGIDPGTHAAPRWSVARAGTGDTLTSSDTVEALRAVRKALNALLRSSAASQTSTTGTTYEETVRKGIVSAFANVFGSQPADAKEFETGFGITLTLADPAPEPFALDAAAFVAAAAGSSSEKILDFFLRDRPGDDQDGFVATLDKVLEGIEEELRRRVGSRGALVDATA